MEHATACSSGRLGAPAPLRPCRPSAQQLFLAGRRYARQERSQAVVQSSMGIGFHQQSSGLVLPNQQLETGPDYGLSVKQMQVLGLTNDGSFATARLPEVKAVSAGQPAECRMLVPARLLGWYISPIRTRLIAKWSGGLLGLRRVKNSCGRRSGAPRSSHAASSSRLQPWP